MADIYNAEVLDLADSAVIDAINSGTHDNKVIVLNSSKTLAANKNITRTLVTLKIVRNGKLNIEVDSTIDCNIIIDSGGLIEVASTKRLTINGVLEAGFYKIFTGAGEVVGKPKIKAVYPVWFGAVGDYAGSNTDNLSSFQAALKLIDSNAGGTISLPNLNENNDYRISDSWNLTKSNTTLFIDKGVTVRTTGATNSGHVIGFAGPSAPSAPIENVTITGGGAVRSRNSGSELVNAIGFSRVTGFQCIGMRVPESKQKGITAQLDCKNGIISDNIVESTGEDGISVELGGMENIVIQNNVIRNTTKKGIVTPAGYDYEKISIVNNLIENTKEIGIYAAGLSGSSIFNGFLISDNRLVYDVDTSTDGQEGIYVRNLNKVSIRNNYIHKSRREGLLIHDCRDVSVMDNLFERPSYKNDDTYDAIRSVGGGGGFVIIGNVIRKDSSDPYKNAIRVDSGVRPIIQANRLETGNTDLISGYLPKVYFDSYVDGDDFTSNFKSSDFDGRRIEQTVTAGSITINHSLGSLAIINITSAGTQTLNDITNGESGDTILIRMRNTSGSSCSIAFPQSPPFIYPSGGLGSIPTGNTRYLGFIKIGSAWQLYINYEYAHSA